MLGKSSADPRMLVSETTHTPSTGKCGFCGITTIHTSVMGSIHLRDGRVMNGKVECLWQVFDSSTR